MWTTLGTALFGLGSAVLPFLNIEIYLTALGATSAFPTREAVLLAAMAAVGQTLGKVVWYYAAQGAVNTAWVQRKLNQPKIADGLQTWSERIRNSPTTASVVIFVSSFLGVPPLLLTAVVAGTVKMRLWHFVAACFLGRFPRFLLLLVGAGWLPFGH